MEVQRSMEERQNLQAALELDKHDILDMLGNREFLRSLLLRCLLVSGKINIFEHNYPNI